MSSHVVDKLVMELELELNKFRAQSNEAERLNTKLKKSLQETEGASESAAKATDDLGESTGKTAKGADQASVSFIAMTRRLTGLFTAITSSFALERLATSIAKANDQLNFMQQRLGMSARGITQLSNAAAALGGDAAAMQGTMRSLNQSIQQLVLMGDSSALPFFNALGIGIVDAQGKVREMDEIMLDMADSFSRMNRQQAFALAAAMGIDDGTANALVQGRDAMQEMMDMQKSMYVSTQAELDASRELNKQRSMLGAHWNGLKVMLGNALVPLLLKLTQGAQTFVDYLMRHERTVKHMFEGLAYVIGVVTAVALGKAALAAFGLVAPFAAAAAGVALLAAGFLLLYDDYQTWSKGGTSLFDWSQFKKFIDDGGLSVEGLAKAFRNLWKDALEAIPVLRVLSNVVSKMIEGDYAGAFKELGNLPSVKGISGPTDETITDDWNRLNGAMRRWMGGGDGMTDEELAIHNEDKRQSEMSGRLAAIEKTARAIGVEPNDLAQIISYETGGTFDPNARNPRSSATGLIQFMAGVGGTPGKYYGMTRDEFGALPFEKQIKFAERYYKERGFRADKPRSLNDAYAAVTGYGYKKGSQAYELNKVWDTNGDGVIDKDEVSNNPSFMAHRRDYFGTSATEGRNFSRSAGGIAAPASAGGASGTWGDVNVNVGTVTVNTSAATLPEATSEGVAAAIARGNNNLNQFGSGLQ